MVQGILVGLVAGVASALLFDAAFTGTPFGLPLFLLLLTGLPIAIAGFGWGTISLLIAAVAGAAGVTALVRWDVVVFAGIFALPVVSAILVAQRRPGSAGGRWYSAGMVLTSATLVLALAVVAIGILAQFDPAALIAELAREAAELAPQIDPNLTVPPTAADYEPGLRVLVPMLPAIFAAMALAVVTLDLYLGAKSARFSSLLRRPEDDLNALTLPWPVPVAFVLATAASFVPGGIGYAAGAIAGASGFAVALVGLAVVHSVTRGSNNRLPVLSTLYALTVILAGVVLILPLSQLSTLTAPVAVVCALTLLLLPALGVAESVFHIRTKRAPPRRPTRTS